MYFFCFISINLFTSVSFNVFFSFIPYLFLFYSMFCSPSFHIYFCFIQCYFLLHSIFVSSSLSLTIIHSDMLSFSFSSIPLILFVLFISIIVILHLKYVERLYCTCLIFLQILFDTFSLFILVPLFGAFFVKSLLIPCVFLVYSLFIRCPFFIVSCVFLILSLLLHNVDNSLFQCCLVRSTLCGGNIPGHLVTMHVMPRLW